MNWQAYQSIIGVDEAGRGCLAGRVYAAAVFAKPGMEQKLFRDSKTLSEKRREELAKSIQENFEYGIAYASVEEIEHLNILKASLLAMKRAVEQIKTKADIVLIDGNKEIPYLKDYKQKAVIKGDSLVPAISAASILAKVKRDQYIRDLSKTYPNYGFEKHKAYATKLHKESIAKWGPCPEHRKTFGGVKEHL